MSDRLRLFPLKTVLFPGAVLNLHIFEPRYKQMVAECLDAGEAFGVVLIEEGQEAGNPSVIPHDVGTTAEIADITELPLGRYYISTIGRRRFRIESIVAREPYLTVEVSYLEDGEVDIEALQSLGDEVRVEFSEYVELLIELSGSYADYELPSDAVSASYLIGDALQVAESLKQRLLELTSPFQRLTVELGFLRRLLPQLRSLVERKREGAQDEAEETAASAQARAEQTKFFGKHFSAN